VSNDPFKFEGSEAELAAMTADLDHMHHDVGMPAMKASIAEWTEELKTGVARPTSRRLFLMGTGGLLAGGAAFAAMAGTGLGSMSAAAASTTTANSAGGLGGLTGDLAIAGLAASLENLAVYAYGAAISAVGAGKFGTNVPPAIGTFATTAKAQHTDHGASWNAIITGAGKSAVTITEPTLTPVVQQKFGQVKTLDDLANLAVLLENIAAQTYQVAITKVKSKGGIATAASIQPVEMQHAAILYFVLGKYPGVQSAAGTPLAFNPTSSAA
jgi:hypothetical protein